MKNLSQVEQIFREQLCKTLEENGDGNYTILSNHATWINLPFLAFCLHEYCGVPKENIHILLGPALTTNALGIAGSNRFANIIKTIPDTPRGNIDYRWVNTIRKWAIRALLDVMRDTSSGSQFLLVSPSGTTDVFDKSSASFSLTEPSQGTRALVQRLSDFTDQIIIGVNDHAIYPGNISLKRGNVYVKVSPVSDKNQLESLPEYVVDEQGRSIASWNRKTGTK